MKVEVLNMNIELMIVIGMGLGIISMVGSIAVIIMAVLSSINYELTNKAIEE